MKLHYVVAKM